MTTFSSTTATAQTPLRQAPLLAIRDLEVRLRHDGTPLVQGANLAVRAGQRVALVGESGSGKSVTAFSILGLLDRIPAEITGGSVMYDGVEYVGAGRRVRKLRGREIAMIFQEPMTSLNPAYSVGAQVAEGIQRHKRVDRRTAWKRAVELLDMVHIPNAEQRAHDYPHRFSGGMRQRVSIASALACEPRLLIADEPTTALDVTVQAGILRLLAEIQEQRSLAVLFVTHDLSLVSEFCSDVVVMYAGQTVQSGPVEDVFERPSHPYVEALFGSIPSMLRGTELRPIPGEVPGPNEWPVGCRFFDRCGHGLAGLCDDAESQAWMIDGATGTRCVRHEDLVLGGVRYE